MRAYLRRAQRAALSLVLGFGWGCSDGPDLILQADFACECLADSLVAGYQRINPTLQIELRKNTAAFNLRAARLGRPAGIWLTALPLDSWTGFIPTKFQMLADDAAVIAYSRKAWASPVPHCCAGPEPETALYTVGETLAERWFPDTCAKPTRGNLNRFRRLDKGEVPCVRAWLSEARRLGLPFRVIKAQNVVPVQAVVLDNSELSSRFADYLNTPTARKVIAKCGY